MDIVKPFVIDSQGKKLRVEPVGISESETELLLMILDYKGEAQKIVINNQQRLKLSKFLTE